MAKKKELYIEMFLYSSALKRRLAKNIIQVDVNLIKLLNIAMLASYKIHKVKPSNKGKYKVELTSQGLKETCFAHIWCYSYHSYY